MGTVVVLYYSQMLTIFFPSCDQLHTFAVTCSLMKWKDFLTKNDPRLWHAVPSCYPTMHPFGWRSRIQVLMHFWEKLLPIFLFLKREKMCHSRLEDPGGALWRAEFRGSPSLIVRHGTGIAVIKLPRCWNEPSRLQNLPVAASFVLLPAFVMIPCGHVSKSAPPPHLYRCWDSDRSTTNWLVH